MEDAQGTASKGCAIATIRGWLVYQPTLSHAPLRKTDVARGEVRADDQVITVVAVGDLAEPFSAMPQGSFVAVDGDIVNHTWRSGGQELSRFEVAAKEIHLCTKPQICFGKSARPKRRS